MKTWSGCQIWIHFSILLKNCDIWYIREKSTVTRFRRKSFCAHEFFVLLTHCLSWIVTARQCTRAPGLRDQFSIGPDPLGRSHPEMDKRGGATSVPTGGCQNQNGRRHRRTIQMLIEKVELVRLWWRKQRRWWRRPIPSAPGPVPKWPANHFREIQQQMKDNTNKYNEKDKEIPGDICIHR